MGYNGTPIKLRPRLDDARGISFGKAFLLELYSTVSSAGCHSERAKKKQKKQTSPCQPRKIFHRSSPWKPSVKLFQVALGILLLIPEILFATSEFAIKKYEQFFFFFFFGSFLMLCRCSKLLFSCMLGPYGEHFYWALHEESTNSIAKKNFRAKILTTAVESPVFK